MPCGRCARRSRGGCACPGASSRGGRRDVGVGCRGGAGPLRRPSPGRTGRVRAGGCSVLRLSRRAGAPPAPGAGRWANRSGRTGPPSCGVQTTGASSRSGFLLRKPGSRITRVTSETEESPLVVAGEPPHGFLGGLRGPGARFGVPDDLVVLAGRADDGCRRGKVAGVHVGEDLPEASPDRFLVQVELEAADFEHVGFLAGLRVSGRMGFMDTKMSCPVALRWRRNRW